MNIYTEEQLIEALQEIGYSPEDVDVIRITLREPRKLKLDKPFPERRVSLYTSNFPAEVTRERQEYFRTDSELILQEIQKQLTPYIKRLADLEALHTRALATREAAERLRKDADKEFAQSVLPRFPDCSEPYKK